MDVCDEVSVLPEDEGEVSVMESRSTDNDTRKTDIDISSDEEDHYDRRNGVLSNCDGEEVEPNYLLEKVVVIERVAQMIHLM